MSSFVTVPLPKSCDRQQIDRTTPHGTRMLLSGKKHTFSTVILLLMCIAASRLCFGQPSSANQRRPPRDANEFAAAAGDDDDDFAEFDDDEFEHMPRRGIANDVGKKQPEKADLPSVPLRPVERSQQQPTAQKAASFNDNAATSKIGKSPRVDAEDDMMVDVEGDELLDADEFESDMPPNQRQTPDTNIPHASNPGVDAGKAAADTNKGDLKIAQVPIALQRRWINYTSEGLMLAIVVIYITMYITGRVINQRLANTWLEYHRDLFEQEFAFVGVPGDKLDNIDEQETKSPSEVMHKEYDHVFTVWCTGRAGMEGMLVQLELLRRQDLVASVVKLVRGAYDRVSFKVILEPGTLDNFVFALVRKQLAPAYAKDMSDLAYFCPERRPGDRFGIPDAFSVMNEIGEVATALFDREFIRILNDYEPLVELLHVSDHYIRNKQDEDNALNAGTTPETKKVIIFTVRLPANKSSQDAMRDMVGVTQFFFYLLEKLSRFHLSREGKSKSDKNRATLQQRYLKATHNQRSEAAQQRREDKKKAEKEKMLNESDPDKQRKWEEREYKRDLKKRGPRIKQLKVKSM